MVGGAFKVIQPWLSQLITSSLPGCICNYSEQVHHSAASRWSWRFNLVMLPGILTPLITNGERHVQPRGWSAVDLGVGESTQLLWGECRWGGRVVYTEDFTKLSSWVRIVWSPGMMGCFVRMAAREQEVSGRWMENSITRNLCFTSWRSARPQFCITRY